MGLNLHFPRVARNTAKIQLARTADRTKCHASHNCTLTVATLRPSYPRLLTTVLPSANTTECVTWWTLVQHGWQCSPVNSGTAPLAMQSCELWYSTAGNAVLWTLVQHGWQCNPVNSGTARLAMQSCEIKICPPNSWLYKLQLLGYGLLRPDTIDGTKCGASSSIYRPKRQNTIKKPRSLQNRDTNHITVTSLRTR